MYINGVFVLMGQISNPQRLTYTQILVKYLPPLRCLGAGGGGGAETNTILKTEKPLGREDPWNEEDHVTAKSHEPWTTANGTTRFVRFCTLSWFIEGKEITPGHDKKERVFCFYCLGKSFRHFVC